MARELAAWRERTASSEDRPVGSVLADPPLVELAKRQPSNLRGPRADPRHPSVAVSSAAGRRSSTPIARGREATPIPREPARDRSEPGDAPLIALAEALLRARALDAGLAYELIASRAELEQIVGAARRGEPRARRAHADRLARELVGADLRDLLQGRSAVAVGPQRRLVLSDGRLGRRRSRVP